MSSIFKLSYKLFCLILLWGVIFPYIIIHAKCFTYIQKYVLVGSEIYSAINYSKHSIKDESVVVLGDSVACQLYGTGPRSDNIYSLACNQAISLAGHYSLLHNMLVNNSHKIKKVYLVMHPISFRNNIDQVYVYNYFIKPFYTRDNISLFTSDTINRIHKIPLYYTCYLPITRVTNYTPDLSGFDQPIVSSARDKTFKISFVSLEYLRKITSELQSAKIKFEVISPVLNEEYRSYDITEFKKDIKDNKLDQSFANYFNFKYLDKKSFRDMLHYSDPTAVTQYLK